MKITVITTTFRKRGEADEVLRRLIEERLCAAAHLERISSSTNWGGVERSDDEWRVAFKTSGVRQRQAVARLRELHTLETPMIIWREEETTDAYAAWVEGQVSGERRLDEDYDDYESDDDDDDLDDDDEDYDDDPDEDADDDYDDNESDDEDPEDDERDERY